MRPTAFVRLLPLVLVAACLPSRDNPDDPGIGPLAKLRVLDAGWPDATTGSCATPDPAALLPEVAVASHGRCLVLDASQSTDRNGVPLAGASYEFRLLPPDGSSLVAVGASASARVLIPATLRATLPDGVLSEWQVIVAAGGHRARATATVVMTNSPPTPVADALRIVPVGGYAYAPSASYSLPFYGDASHDPDGDDLALCWHFTDGQADPPCRHRADPPVMRTFPSAPGEFVAWVVASDGHGAVSSAAPTVVAIRPQPAWGNPPGGFDALYGTEPSSVGGANETPTRATAFLDRGAGQSRLIAGSTSTLGLYGWPATTTLLSSAAEGTGVPMRLFLDAQGGRVWGVNAGSGSDGIASWRISGDTITGEQTVPGPGSLLGGVGRLFGETDAVGRLWAVAENNAASGAVLETVDATGAFAFFHPGNAVGFSKRPGTEEMWILLDDTAGGATLGRWTSSASDTPESVSVDPALVGAVGPMWADTDAFWLLSNDRGLLLVDANALLAGESFDAAVLQEEPLDVGATDVGDDWLVDPASGELTACTPDGFVVHAVPFGAVTAAPSDDYCALSSIDGQGRVRYRYELVGSSFVALAQRDGFDQTTGPAPLLSTPFYAQSQLGARQLVTRDATNGGLWLATGRPSLAFLSPDGTVREWSTWSDGTATHPMPAFRGGINVSADGSTVWAFGSDPVSNTFEGLLRLQVTPGGLVGGFVPLVPSIALDLFNGTRGVLGLRGATSDHAYARAAGTNVISLLDTQGGSSSAITMSEATNPGAQLTGAPDGSVCIADGPFTPNGTSYFIRVRHVTAAGTIDQLQDVAMADGFEMLTSVSAGRAAGDGCWISWANVNSGITGGIAQVRNNVVFHTLTIASGGSPYQVSAVGTNEVWMSQSTDGAFHYSTVHLTFDNVSGSSTVVDQRPVATVDSGPIVP